MSYGRISEAYWHDDVIRALTEPARYFMLYLMSCPHGNRLGLFVLDLSYAAADLDSDDVEWSRAKVSGILQELVEKGRIRWDRRNRVVFVRYYLRHNVLANQSVVKGALNDLAGLPRTELLQDLLETVIEERKSESELPIRAHYADLEDKLRRRCGINGIKRHNGADSEESHSAPHSDPHHAVVSDDTVGARARAALPPPTLPSLTEPNRTHPPPADRVKHGVGEDDLTIETKKSQPTARNGIISIHGGKKGPVEIEGQLVGVGLDVNRYRAFCLERRDPPEIIAAAIAYLPVVTGLDPPLSLALWETDLAIYEQCVGMAYKNQEPNDGI